MRIIVFCHPDQSIPGSDVGFPANALNELRRLGMTELKMSSRKNRSISGTITGGSPYYLLALIRAQGWVKATETLEV